MPAPDRPLLRRLPILVIGAVALAGLVLLRDPVSLATLRANRDALLAFREAHYLAAVLLFLAAYVAIVALSLPGATLATLTGGFLFGTFPGIFYNVAAATAGAVLIFLAARAGIGASVAARIAAAGGRAERLRAALLRDEVPVLLSMRLMPVVPFFLANLIPAFVGVRLDRFALTTAIGILPAALVFTSVGAGLDRVFARAGLPDVGVMLQPALFWPLVGLALLAAGPALWRALRRHPRAEA